MCAMLLGFVVYRSSYAGKIQKGYNALGEQDYNKAIKHFQSAADKKRERADAYIGLSEVYIEMGDLFSAEEVFLTQIEYQESNADIYRGAAEFYEKTKQVEKIPLLLDACSEISVLEAMKDYIVEVPEFSLEEGIYEEAQQLELTAGENKVYYTLDDSIPTTKDGTKYGTTIQLDEGEWNVNAIAINAKGIPSLVVTKKIVVELPAAEPPIVYPSTGLYESETEITIQVPEGLTAYYMFDQTVLTPENGNRYLGPIKMPEGNHIFSAILVDDRTGKASEVTIRNYDLQIVSEEEAADEKPDGQE